MLSLKEMFWVFAAGGTGASLRVALVPFLDARLGHVLPSVGTLLVNVLGCFLIGVGAGALPSGPLRPILLGGLLGGFTTYSAFGLLKVELAQDARYGAFAAQVLLHVAVGLTAVWLGLALGRAMGSPAASEVSES